VELIRNPEKKTWDYLTRRPGLSDAGLVTLVEDIINQVRQGGDVALIELTAKYDGIREVSLPFKVPDREADLPAELKSAIKTAYQNIYNFHRQQQENMAPVETMPGVRCWRRATPIDKVGLYVPGGSAPLFSSLLMLAIPAQIAGCGQIVVCTPPQQDGSIHPAIVYTAQLLKIECLYPVGGAQAIAAMAFGTETIPKVYKILGPGNQYVTMAKQILSQQVAIDFPAGPSEVAILADEKANPDYIAADLLSQAEHGPDSQVVLATNSGPLLSRVEDSLKQQLDSLPRKSIAEKALEQSKLVLFDDLDTAMQFLNTYAPEHLILNVEEAGRWADRVTNAGSVFLGAFTPESAGDYASGTNHTLPTNGNARMYAGVSLDTFVKKITFQEISREGLESIGDTIELMASAEGLEAHKRAVSIRRSKAHHS
jgi:histidinol dehydrogenase